jgi:hypothetical protein
MYKACRMRSRIIYKIIFTAPFLLSLQSPAALPLQLLHYGAIKLAIAPTQPTSSRTISHHPSASFPMAETKEGIGKQS